MSRTSFACAGVCVALAVFIAPAALSKSRKQRVPDGEVLFAFTTDEENAAVQLAQLKCDGGDCVESSAILTECDPAKHPPRRTLIVDSLSTRQGQLSVSAERKGDRAILSIEEWVPFAQVTIRLLVKVNSESNRFVSIEEFSGVRVERSIGTAKQSERKAYHLKRLSPAERQLPACGLKLLENAFQLAEP